jgi:hypothetical protein
VGQSVHSKVNFDDRNPIFEQFSAINKDLLQSHFSFDLENTHNPTVIQHHPYSSDEDANPPVYSSKLGRLADIEAL